MFKNFKKIGKKSEILKCSTRHNRPMPWQTESFLEIGTREIFTEEHDFAREQFRYE